MMITLSRLYRDGVEARAVVDELKATGLPEGDIGIIAPSQSRLRGRDSRNHTANRSASEWVGRIVKVGPVQTIDKTPGYDLERDRAET